MGDRQFVYVVLSKESNATDTGERKLFADLFTDYVREVRPRIDPTQNVTVTVDLELHHVKQMVLYETHLQRLTSFLLIFASSFAVLETNL